MSTTIGTDTGPKVPKQKPAAEDYSAQARRMMRSTIPPISAETRNRARKGLAGLAVDADDYRFLAGALGLDPRWEGPVPWAR